MMRRRSVITLLAIIVALVGGASAALAAMVRHVPAFYNDAAVANDPQRPIKSRECFQRSIELWNDIGNGLPWEKEFVQDHLNSYFQEEDNRSSAGLIELPDRIRDIRFAFNQDRGRIGFRYGA